MNNPANNIAGQTPRIVMRVHQKIRAKIFFKGQLHAEIVLNELSTRGFSFNIEKIEGFPYFFELEFQLRPFAKLIKAKAEIKNRKELSQGLRVGCFFSDISDEDRNSIANHLSRYVNFYIPHTIVSVASFLLLADATVRLLAYFINLYYSATEFGRNFQTIYDQDYSYGIILLFYLINAFVAFVFTDRILERKTKKDFLFSMIYLVPAFLFLVIKNIIYWQYGLWQQDLLFVRAFLWGELLLICFTLYAIWTGINLYRKIDIVSDSLDSHLPITAK